MPMISNGPAGVNTSQKVQQNLLIRHRGGAPGDLNRYCE